MGAWGHGIYSNDTAMDFVDELIEHAFKKADMNEDYLVVADMIKGRGTIATKQQAKKIREVIKEEIDNLGCWVADSQEKRRVILEDFLKWFSDKENIMNT